MYGAPRSKDLNLPSQQHPAANGVRTPPQTSSPGLLRYRSAPSAMFGDVCGGFLPASAGAGGAGHRPGSPDHAADTSFARLLSGHHHHQHHPEMRDKPPRPAAGHFAEDAAAASMASQQQQLMYQSQQQMAAMEGLFRTASSGATDPVVAAAGGGNDSLLRQSSSPAGFLNHLNMGNGFGNMLRAGMAAGGGAAGGGGYRNGDARLKGQLSFSSRQGSVMSQISEMVGEEMGGGSSGDDEAGSYGGIPGYPVVAPSGVAGWDEPSPSPSPTLLTSDGLSGPAAKRRPREDANGGSRQLKPQFSLPAGSKPPPEMAAIEKFLQFQDSVPCKIRAKRGCATHPRSIAERVRRTKISERIRKLQELVPNMEKQTNTSDMLDLAVDYIKELQMQVKVMNDGRASCTCAAGRPQKHFAG